MRMGRFQQTTDFGLETMDCFIVLNNRKMRTIPASDEN